MTKGYADDGFGNLVPLSSPFGKTTTCYMRDNGKLARYECWTPDHALAIDVVRSELGHIRLSRNGKWSGGPVLAIIAGGKPS